MGFGTNEEAPRESEQQSLAKEWSGNVFRQVAGFLRPFIRRGLSLRWG